MKSFYFVGTKFRGLTTMDMFVSTFIYGFGIIQYKTKMNKSFVGTLNSWNTKINVQQIKMMSQ